MKPPSPELIERIIEDIVTHGMLCADRISNLMRNYYSAAHLHTRKAPVAEFGTHKGLTAALLTAMGAENVWVYDTFTGLPEPDPVHDGDYLKKGMMACTPEDVYRTFATYKLRPPVVVKTVIKEDAITAKELPKQRFAFVHIDLDLYEGTLAALWTAHEHMLRNGIGIVDDLGRPKMPGVMRAMVESQIPYRLAEGSFGESFQAVFERT